MKPPKLHWTAYLWPGLPHLWNRGSWAGLALAVGFTVLLNVWLASTLVWKEWLPAKVTPVGGIVLAVLWLLAWAEARADWRRYLAEFAEQDGLDHDQRSELRFKEAQEKYLAGDWVGAEKLLLKILKHEQRDVAARLMLATLWRRLERTEDACQELDRIEKLEAASQWQAEIAAERHLLQREHEEIETLEEVTIPVEVSLVEEDSPVILPIANETADNKNKEDTQEQRRVA